MKYTILVVRMRVHKEMKRMNSLRLSPVVVSYTNLQGKSLPTCPAKHYSAELIPRLEGTCVTVRLMLKFFVLFNK